MDDDAGRVAKSDQNRQSALDHLRKAKQFVLISTADLLPNQVDELGDEGADITLQIIMDCDGAFLHAGMDAVARRVIAREIFPEGFDDWGRTGPHE